MLSDGDMVAIMGREPSAQGHFALPCFPASLIELLASVKQWVYFTLRSYAVLKWKHSSLTSSDTEIALDLEQCGIYTTASSSCLSACSMQLYIFS